MLRGLILLIGLLVTATGIHAVARSSGPASKASGAPAAVGPADLPVAKALQSLLPKVVVTLVSGASRTAVEIFYAERRFAPLWVKDGAPTPNALQAIAYLREVAQVGLDPADYVYPGLQFAGSPDVVARSELEFTVLILKYAHDAYSGRIAPKRVSGDIEYERRPPAAVRILKELASTTDIVAYLDGFNPPHAEFRALAARLAGLSTMNDEGSKRMRDLILANLERWRWMPRELGSTYVIVNVPDYSLRLIKDGSLEHVARVVVGRPSSATPLFSAKMTSITMNPVWNVPDSIAEKEYLPSLKDDPKLLERLGLQMEQRADGSIHLSQQPGESNALGRIRFNLPNRYLIYQHDTPMVEDLVLPKRAFSHGCIRVEAPLYYAHALLAAARPSEDFSMEALWKLIGEREVELPFARPIPVHITYQTALIDDDDRLVLRDDIYGYDAAMLSVLAEDALARDIARLGRAKAAQLLPVVVQPQSFPGRLIRWLKRQTKQVFSTAPRLSSR